MFGYKKLKQDIEKLTNFAGAVSENYLIFTTSSDEQFATIIERQDGLMQTITDNATTIQEVKDTIKAKAYESIIKMDQMSSKDAVKAMIESIIK